MASFVLNRISIEAEHSLTSGKILHKKTHLNVLNHLCFSFDKSFYTQALFIGSHRRPCERKSIAARSSLIKTLDDYVQLTFTAFFYIHNTSLQLFKCCPYHSPAAKAMYCSTLYTQKNPYCIFLFHSLVFI